MKILKGIILTFMLLFCFGSNLFAAEEKNDVNAKYGYTKGDTFYNYIFKNNKINVNLDGTIFDITTDNNTDNGLKITIIPTKDNALNWLNGITSLTNIKGYYIFFENIPIGNINISSSNKEKVLENISSGGKILTTSQNLINVKNKSYIAFGNQTASNVINFNTDGYGSVIIEGVSYSDNFNYKTNKSNINIIIRPISGYEIDSVICDSINITNSVKGGFLTINNLKQTQNITITHKKREEKKESNYYKLMGTIAKNGNFLSNVQLELYSDILKTTTDSKGNFVFEEVPLGFHSLTAYIDNKVVGYAEFVLESNNNTKIETLNENNVSQILIGNDINGLILTLDIDNDNRIQFNSINEFESENTSIWIIISVGIILTIGIIALIKIKSNKHIQ